MILDAFIPKSRLVGICQDGWLRYLGLNRHYHCGLASLAQAMYGVLRSCMYTRMSGEWRRDEGKWVW